MTPDGAGYVVARRVIRQSPLSDAPDVPTGTVGHLEDEIAMDDAIFVDFGHDYGVVLCDIDDLR